MRLIIAEKPKMGKEIATNLPGQKSYNQTHIECGDTVVTWCFGHILEQKMPVDYNEVWKQWTFETLPMVPTTWELKIKDDAKEQFNIIKKLANEATTIVNAGDPDREGQLLVDEVLHFIGNTKPVGRLWMSSWDEATVKAALANIRPNAEYIGYYNAALARSRADWLVGLNLTRAATIAGRNAGYEGTLSVGRVQTPTLALIVKRDELIEAHKTVMHYGVAGIFEHANGTFSAKWQSGDDLITDKSAADKVASLINKNAGRITEYNTKNGTESAPLPFNLAKLQMAASKSFGFTAQKTLDTAQSLYEKKLTSYPRSDCQYLPTSQHSDAKRIIQALPGDLTGSVDLTRIHAAFNDTEVTAHHAIIPLGNVVSGLTGDEEKLYNLVSKSYIALFMPVAQFTTVKIKLTIAAESFSASSKTYTAQGWKSIYTIEPEDDEQPESDKLPFFNIGDKVDCVRADVTQTQTKPPACFNDASLIDAMSNIYRHVTDENIKARLKETAGLGTEATRSNIIEELIKKSLLRREKGKGKAMQIISTPAGRKLVHALPDKLTSPELTALFEQFLESISNNETTVEEFLDLQLSFVEKQIENIKSAQIAAPTHKCPKCQSGLRKRNRKDGKGAFWSCSKYPACDFACDDKKVAPDFSPKRKK